MQRLKTRAQFQAVLAGRIIAKTTHFALHCSSLDVSYEAGKVNKAAVTREANVSTSLFRQQDMWIGALIPKRWAKQAVTRNAIKRQIYAVSRESCRSYPHLAFVVRLRCSFARSEFLSAVSNQLNNTVRAEVQALMEFGVTAK